MITEIRPGFFQTTLPNGVTWSYSARDMKDAKSKLSDQIKRTEKRNKKGIGDKIFSYPIINK
jgi:hypothetical protein